MNIEKTINEGNLIITPVGRIDSSTAEEFDAAINSELPETFGTLTVDMKAVDFISSKGLRVLVSAYKKMKNKDVILKNPNGSVKEVLKLSGLLKIFKIDETKR